MAASKTALTRLEADSTTEAYLHMKARIRDAQRVYDEARRNGAGLYEALRFARRQIEAAWRAKVKHDAELENRPPPEEDLEEELFGGVEEVDMNLATRLWGEEAESVVEHNRRFPFSERSQVEPDEGHSDEGVPPAVDREDGPHKGSGLMGWGDEVQSILSSLE